MLTKNNKRKITGQLLGSLWFLCFISLPTAIHAQGYIAGQITSTVTATFEVDIFNPTNAVLVTTVYANNAGFYNSGPLAAGDYKVRLSQYIDQKSETKAGVVFPIFFGANGEDNFELGTPVSVKDGQTTKVDGTLLENPTPAPPKICVFGAFGTITDASNGSPLAGTKVSVIEAVNAMPLFAAYTDSTGYYGGNAGLTPYCGQAKIRLSDPSADYLPEFYGANGQDNFSLGASVDNGSEASTTMIKLTPASSIDSYTNTITNSSLPPDMQTNMTGLLSKASAIVTDSNPNNDVAACGILKSTINQINAALNKGQLSTYEADTLMESANMARTTIGCK